MTGVVRKSKQADVRTANKETWPFSAWGISGLEFPFLSSWAWRRGAAGKLLLDTRTLWKSGLDRRATEPWWGFDNASLGHPDLR